MCFGSISLQDNGCAYIIGLVWCHTSFGYVFITEWYEYDSINIREGGDVRENRASLTSR